jgi:sporulation related protein
MSASFDSVTAAALEPRLSGAIRLFIGFITGALFALLPMYYFYMGRDAALRDVPAAVPVANSSTGQPAATDKPGSVTPRFAARMTYELSQLPQELTAPVKSPAPVASAPSEATQPPALERAAAKTPDDVASSASRIVNAKPISAAPPDPRDTTREMAKEARRVPEKTVRARETPAPAAALVKPQIVEGRDIVIAPRSDKKPVETAAVIASAPAVSSVTPIGPAAEKTQRQAPTRSAAREPDQRLASAAATPATVNATRPEKVMTAGAARDLVQSRLAATREWLAASPQTAHTIQLLGASSDEQLKTQLKALSKLLEPGKIYVFRTIAQGNPSTTVVYGAYTDRQAALQALAKLPAAITANKPVLRTVSGIRAEMKQHKTDS